MQRIIKEWGNFGKSIQVRPSTGEKHWELARGVGIFEKIAQVFRDGMVTAMGLPNHLQLQPNILASQLLRETPSVVQYKLCGEKSVINLRKTNSALISDALRKQRGIPGKKA